MYILGGTFGMRKCYLMRKRLSMVFFTLLLHHFYQVYFTASVYSSPVTGSSQVFLFV